MDDRQAELFDELRRRTGITPKELALYARRCERQAMRYFTGDSDLPVEVANSIIVRHPDPRVGDAISDFVHEGSGRISIRIDGSECTDLNHDGKTDGEDQRHALADMIREQAGVLDANLNWADLEPRLRNLIRHAHCLFAIGKAASSHTARKPAKPLRFAEGGGR